MTSVWNAPFQEGRSWSLTRTACIFICFFGILSLATDTANAQDEDAGGAAVQPDQTTPEVPDAGDSGDTDSGDTDSGDTDQATNPADNQADKAPQ
ncbi:MAG: hypothetical protein AAFN70_03770, partial [Planctomycetota bacterium]